MSKKKKAILTAIKILSILLLIGSGSAFKRGYTNLGSALGFNAIYMLVIYERRSINNES